jgi:hypothetical protein
MPNSIFRPVTGCLGFYQLLPEICLKTLKSQSALGRVILWKDLLLEFSLSKICAAYTITEALEFTVGKLAIEKHIKLSKDLI